MQKIKTVLNAINNWFNKFIQNGGDNVFLEYLIKYLMTCGIGANIALIIMIITSLV